MTIAPLSGHVERVFIAPRTAAMSQIAYWMLILTFGLNCLQTAGLSVTSRRCNVSIIDNVDCALEVRHYERLNEDVLLSIMLCCLCCSGEQFRRRLPRRSHPVRARRQRDARSETGPEERHGDHTQNVESLFPRFAPTALTSDRYDTCCQNNKLTTWQFDFCYALFAVFYIMLFLFFIWHFLSNTTHIFLQ